MRHSIVVGLAFLICVLAAFSCGTRATTDDDAGFDAGLPDAGPADSGADAGADAGIDAGADSGAAPDAGLPDAGVDGGEPADTGTDAGQDAGMDGGHDGGLDAGGRPPTTVKETVMPVLPLTKLKDYKTNPNAGKYTFDGPGEPHFYRDDLFTGASRDAAPVTSFLYIGHISDPHVVDYQSPMRDVKLVDPLLNGFFRPQEGFAIHTLDAILVTFNQLSAYRPMNAVVISGDAADNNQGNEVRFMIDTVDGRLVDTNSGVFPNPAQSDMNMCTAHQTSGLDKTIPWYFVPGNHDTLVMGNLPLANRTKTPAEQELEVSKTIEYQTATGIESKASIMCQDPIIFPADLVHAVVPRNMSRTQVTHHALLETFFDTTSLPKGHGFTQDSIDNDFGIYAVDLQNDPDGKPLVRFIGLDFTWSNILELDNGNIRQPVFDFLKAELAKAVTDKVLVIVASHFQSESIAAETEVKAAVLVSEMIANPNVILHMVGHGHTNKVYVHASGKKDGAGYWEVEAPSTLDFPQQARVIELAYMDDGRGAIYVTNIDHNSPAGSPAYRAREISIFDIQQGIGSANHLGEVQERNVLLRFSVPADVKARLEALPHVPVESLNFYR